MKAKVAVGALALCLTATACSPEQIAWWHAKVDSAVAAGKLCPETAPIIELTGLPEHFDVVIWRESNCQPGAVNRGSGTLGLTQIMPFWLRDLCPLGIACTRDDLLDPTRNVIAAAYVYSVQGPSAWSETW